MDANCYQGTMDIFNSGMEPKKHRTTWIEWIYIGGKIKEGNSKRGNPQVSTTIGNVSPMDSIVLHQAHIAEILNWTKEHLDAYLASAEVILDQHEAPD